MGHLLLPAAPGIAPETMYPPGMVCSWCRSLLGLAAALPVACGEPRTPPPPADTTVVSVTTTAPLDPSVVAAVSASAVAATSASAVASAAGWRPHPASSDDFADLPPLPAHAGRCDGAAPARSGELGYYAANPVRAELARLRPRWTQCYKTRLKTSPSLAGRIEVRFQIDRQGRVCQASAVRATLPDEWLIECVVRSLYSLRVSPPPEPVTIVYPLVFQPGATASE
jgi:hypothetical protein